MKKITLALMIIFSATCYSGDLKYTIWIDDFGSSHSEQATEYFETESYIAIKSEHGEMKTISKCRVLNIELNEDK